jgi:hypothetical protein
MDAVAIAIELEASYQIWRAQHERYLLLSRRVWLNDAAVSEVQAVGLNSGQAEVDAACDPAADSLPNDKMKIAVTDDVAVHEVEMISREARPAWPGVTAKSLSCR